MSRPSESYVQGVSPDIRTRNTRRYLTQGTAYEQTRKSHPEVILKMQSRVMAAKDGSCRDIPVISEERKCR